MTKLIINADDFGYSKGVNLGILEAFQNGVVTSATMMTNMPGAAHAAALALDNPELGVGIHLVLDCNKPVSDNVPSLVDENGFFHKKIELAESSHIEKEIHSQIEKFLSFGLTPTHFDSHHHVHGHEKVYPIVKKAAEQYQVPIRKVSADPDHSSNRVLPTTQFFIHEFYGEDLSTALLIEHLKKSIAFETVELMCHPAYVDEPLLTGSSYSIQRVRELAILCDPAVRRFMEESMIELQSYRDIFE